MTTPTNLQQIQADIAEQAAAQQHATCEAQLRDRWGLAYQHNLQRAVRAYEASTGMPATTAPPHIGNDARTLEALARMPDAEEKESAELMRQMMEPGITRDQKEALMLKRRLLFERKYGR